MVQHTALSTRAQLWVLFALFVYAPLPLASNRPWALALLGVMTGGLLLWTVWRPGAQSLAWQRARVPLMLLLLWMGLLAMQLVPLPDAFLHLLDQRVASGFALADASRGTISTDPYSTRLYLAKAVILSAVFWLVVTLVNSRRRIEWLAGVIVFSGLLQAVIGVVLMATGTTFQLFFVPMVDARAHGSFVYHNHFAGYLEMTLAVGIGLMIAKLDPGSVESWKQRLHGWLAVLLSSKAVLRLALIVMVIGLVASRSRMGNAAFFASLLIVGLFTVIFSKHAARTTVYFIVSLIVLDVVIIGGMVGVEKVVQRIENTNLEMQVKSTVPAASANVEHSLQKLSPEESFEERSAAGLASVQIVRDFSWLGTGGGTFHLVFPHYKPARLSSGYWDHPHNDFVEFAGEVGLLGMLLLIVMVIHSLLKSAAQIVRSRDRLALGMAFASLMGVISLLIHAAVDFNLQNPANAMLFLTLLSLPYIKIFAKGSGRDL